MHVIEICPKCGAYIRDIVLTVDPPIPRKECTRCDWSWQGEKDNEVVRVPFDTKKVYA